MARFKSRRPGRRPGKVASGRVAVSALAGQEREGSDIRGGIVVQGGTEFGFKDASLCWCWPALLVLWLARFGYRRVEQTVTFDEAAVFHLGAVLELRFGDCADVNLDER
jgi:hypothetical protein